ncbi:MAG TPA: IS1634 family transposase [Terriglobia bacterium]|nr:IS1634 family transposase [Terriglobia bacterium]HEV2268519.1 IS1634 family transposase [Steroidobacteraceae bacterium]
MFFRIKPSGARRYLQIVENTRDGARTVQRVLATLGRIEELQAGGKLDVLLRSGARFCDSALLISALQAGTLETSAALRLGAPMIFGRLWEQTGCRKVIEQLATGRGFGFPLERAVFASVLHRLVISGSDRACEKWLDAYHVDGAEGLELHQLYRAMAWLGEELADQSGATRAPRRNKDLLEEALFERRRSLFSDLSVVLFDTTSLYFYGAGGASLGRHGKSKDHRPDLRQVVVGVVLDGEGRPICSETWAGNATDVKALLPVVGRLRERFGITRMCVVADRGMISAATIAELDAQGIEYILGARERSDSEVREIVLADNKPMAPLVIPRARGAETILEVKEVVVGDWGAGTKPRRYVVCFNPEEAKRDAAARAAILDSLRIALQQGDKQLVGNAGYRRFLATPRQGHFEIDAERIAEDARFDGLYVLRTNSKLPPLSIALAYRQLWKVEAIFKTAKSILETRPIYHQSDTTIAGHLFCSFLALLLRKELDERLAAAGVSAEWADVVRDLDRVEQITVQQDAKRFALRPQAPGCAGSVFQAVGVALPPLVRQLPHATPPPPSPPIPPQRRRGRPRRGATSP